MALPSLRSVKIIFTSLVRDREFIILTIVILSKVAYLGQLSGHQFQWMRFWSKLGILIFKRFQWTGSVYWEVPSNKKIHIFKHSFLKSSLLKSEHFCLPWFLFWGIRCVLRGQALMFVFWRWFTQGHMI